MRMIKLPFSVYFDDEDFKNPAVLQALIISKEREIKDRTGDLEEESQKLIALKSKLQNLQSNPQLPNGMKLDGPRNS